MFKSEAMLLLAAMSHFITALLVTVFPLKTVHVLDRSEICTACINWNRMVLDGSWATVRVATLRNHKLD
jgi:hypothetical protein